MKRAILTKVFEELGTDKPHKEPGADGKGGVKDEDEAKRPLSPVEPGSGTVATEMPIQVKTDGGANKADVRPANDSVDVKEESEVKAGGSSAQAQNGQSSNSAAIKDEASRKPGRGRKKGTDGGAAKPYEGLFDAKFNPDNDKFEITDLRDLPGGDKTWYEEAHCLVCGSRID